MNSRVLSLFALSALVTGGTRPALDPATPERLGGAVRYLTQLSTDKPIYRVGETVYVRGVVLDANTHVPAPNGQLAMVTIKGPKGEVLSTGQANLVDGAFGFSWLVPEGQAGGECLVSAVGSTGQAPAERKFDVRVYRPPRLKNQITFARDGYGAGDVLTATLETMRAEGGVPTGAKIVAVARVDEVDVAKAPCTLNERGQCTVSLKLPASIERGEGVLSFTIEDGGVIETATKTIPLLVNSFDVALYPEGGELVAGLSARVYFEARTLAKKPADLAGVVVDSKGATVASFRSEHEGRGRFEFVPVAGQTYTLKILEPSNVRKTVPVPAAVAQGVALRSLSDVVGATERVKLDLAWPFDRPVKVTLRQRDVELDSVTLDGSKHHGSVTLDPKGADGVLVATVTSSDGLPLAERLLFREPKKSLSISMTANHPRTVPGAPVVLTVRTSVDGVPTSAMVGLSVTDDAVQELIEKREQAPSLPVMVLLENDVKELADAQVYLDAKNPKSKLAVDLLLGTQGWRRFGLMKVNEFVAAQADAARRVLALYEPPLPPPDFGPEMAFGGAPGRPVALAEALAMPAPPPAAPMKPAPMAAPVAAPKPVPAPIIVAQPAAPKPDALGPIAREDKQVARKRAFREQAPVVVVREYAHLVRPNRAPNDRLDFAETLYWVAALRTNERGEATVTFGTSDAVTSFRASAGGYTSAGVLGGAELKIDSVKPFYLEPKLPLEVTEGDVIRLPLAFINGTREGLSNVSFRLDTRADLRFKPLQNFALGADERARRVLELTVGPKSRTTELTLNATAGSYLDTVTRPLAIKPRGFPTQVASGGLLEANGRADARFTLAADTVPGSAHTSIAIYPSPAGNLASALKSMIREPSGCFEQTSSTTYPMTMALQYFTTHTGAEPAVVHDAQDKLERGYKRLVGFECKEKGYEWFGQDPGHEALTAYGILEFTDMQKVRAVDATMLANSRNWLLKQRNGKGGFERKRRALHTWVEDQDTSDAYITWALLEAGTPSRELTAELAHVKAAGLASSNSYVVAVAANVASLGKDSATALKLLKKLADQQNDAGLVEGSTQSIVGSTGRSLLIETTAFATLGWLRVGEAFVGNIEKAMKGLAEASTDGSYGATQSTVLALRAVLEYDTQRNATRKPGAVKLLVDGKAVGGALKYDGSTQTAVEFPEVAELLTPGDHTLSLVQEGGSRLPWSMSIRSNRVKPDSATDADLALEVKLSAGAVREGDVVEATARVSNTTDRQLATVVAIVGVPGGLEPRVDQLKELVTQGTIDAYEVMGRDVVLYWRGMTPKQQVRVPLSLVAAVPGTYTGPASRAYLYYGDEKKAWVPGLVADIAAK